MIMGMAPAWLLSKCNGFRIIVWCNYYILKLLIDLELEVEHDDQAIMPLFDYLRVDASLQTLNADHLLWETRQSRCNGEDVGKEFLVDWRIQVVDTSWTFDLLRV